MLNHIVSRIVFIYNWDNRNNIVKALLDNYDNIEFIKNGEIDLTPAPKIHTDVLYDLGYVFSNEITTVETLTVFPAKYFCPINFRTDKLVITNETYSIHHYTASWYNETQRCALNMKRKLGHFLPHKIAAILGTGLAIAKCEGFVAFFKWIFKKRGRQHS
jgi:hypothetical protein